MKRETKEVLVIIRNAVDALLGWAKFQLLLAVLVMPLMQGRPLLILSVVGACMTTYFLFCWGEGRL